MKHFCKVFQKLCPQPNQGAVQCENSTLDEPPKTPLPGPFFLVATQPHTAPTAAFPGQQSCSVSAATAMIAFPPAASCCHGNACRGIARDHTKTPHDLRDAERRDPQSWRADVNGLGTWHTKVRAAAAEHAAPAGRTRPFACTICATAYPPAADQRPAPGPFVLAGHGPRNMSSRPRPNGRSPAWRRVSMALDFRRFHKKKRPTYSAGAFLDDAHFIRP